MLHYEDLVSGTERILRALCRHWRIRYVPAMAALDGSLERRMVVSTDRERGLFGEKRPKLLSRAFESTCFQINPFPPDKPSREEELAIAEILLPSYSLLPR